jgi:hypothetical protein
MHLKTTPIPFNPRPSFHWDTPGEGESGQGENASHEKDEKKGKVEEKPDPVAEAVKAERAKWEREQADREAKAKADREAEEAKKRGEWEKVAADEKSKREAAEAKVFYSEVKDKLTKHFAEKHPEYGVAFVDLIMPAIEKELKPGAKDDDVKKLVEAKAKSFVDALPKTQIGGPPGNRGNNQSLNQSFSRTRGGRVTQPGDHARAAADILVGRRPSAN